MRCFKAIEPFVALSFDLDDTLYNNRIVIRQAEEAMQQALQKLLPEQDGIDPDYWWQQRKELAATTPEIRHDVSLWRLAGLELGLKKLGVAQHQIPAIAEQAFQDFYQARSQFEVPVATHELLRALCKRYPLVSITNGNADVKRLKLSHYFQHSLRAGPDGRMKPYPDLFHSACQRLNILPSQLLHIGDSSQADVMGAIEAGCQAVWLRRAGTSTHVLPQFQISTLDELQLLL